MTAIAADLTAGSTIQLRLKTGMYLEMENMAKTITKTKEKKRQDNQNMQGNPNMGNPTTWKNNHMDRYQYPNNTPFLAGPNPYEAYKDPNRDMNMIMKIGQMFQTMSSQIMNMHW